jgi:hypothetical protein
LLSKFSNPILDFEIPPLEFLVHIPGKLLFKTSEVDQELEYEV